MILSADYANDTYEFYLDIRSSPLAQTERFTTIHYRNEVHTAAESLGLGIDTNDNDNIVNFPLAAGEIFELDDLVVFPLNVHLSALRMSLFPVKLQSTRRTSNTVCDGLADNRSTIY